MGYRVRIKKFFQIKVDVLDLVTRIAAFLFVIHIIYHKTQQQIIAVACLVISVIGIRKINEYTQIVMDKLKKSSKGVFPFGSGGYDTTKPMSPVALATLKEIGQEANTAKELIESYNNFLCEATMAIHSNEWEKAAQCIEKALKLQPNNIPLQIQLAIIYGENIEDKDKAISLCKEVLKQDVNNISGKFNLAVYTSHLKGDEESLSIYLEAEKLIKAQGLMETEIGGKLNIFVGSCFKGLGNKTEAGKRYEKAIEILHGLAQENSSSAFWLVDAENNLKKLFEREI